MCLIVVKQPEAFITRKHLKRCFTANNDGAGFMCADNNKLYVHKGFMSFRPFYKTFREQERAFPDSAFVLHFRINATGGVSRENTHPFSVNDDLAIVHNGVVSSLGSVYVNDTFIFATQILSRLPKDFLNNTDIKEVIENIAIVTHSKFVFMDNKGRVTIFNESAGYWEDNMWFSNTSGSTAWAAVYTQANYEEGCYNPVNTGYIYNKKQNYDEYNACCVCNISRKTWLMRKIPGDRYLCDGCWDIVTNNIEIHCPFCYNSITLTKYGICPHCGERIFDEDILPYLTDVDKLFS